MINYNKPNTILKSPDDMFYFPITWDLGRRCNLDCSYCPIHQHDNFSPHASLDGLKATISFTKNYIDALRNYIRIDNFGVSITGGEPTNNPNLLDLCKYTNDLIDRRMLSITSNGVMSSKLAENLSRELKNIRISYHCEAPPKIKNRVVDNIFKMKEILGNKISVNIMFHVDYFEECVNLATLLKKNNILFTPRVIGELPNKRNHVYTDEQMKFFEEFYDINIKKGTKKTGREVLGRACCSRKTLILEFDDEIKESTIISNTEFEDYYCFINMQWLHIDQQTRELFYHETCKALLGKKRGSFGSLDNLDKVITELHKYHSKPKIEFIRCPNKLCNCGICVPKSRSLTRAQQIFSTIKKQNVQQTA